ncbi:unnamed protein product [Acanthoscelides obtectus]|uniref:Craniofacial development protein 1 n=1 Tax=Acanthoscelides obtectus TaxID=200917 RepID=A0A9P0PXL0_ACAOB|nr:unnamed protein product [Acanthoscelides obtectus]CAK1647535.1 Craniofacial development protein 1 [Acanthoscelides obtectus]
MNTEDFPDESDSSDEDYIPDEKQEVVSEVESDGDPEDNFSDPEDLKKNTKGRKKGKTKKKETVKSKEAQCGHSTQDKQGESKINEEKKKKEEDLWADFMKDTGFKPKNRTVDSTSRHVTSTSTYNDKKVVSALEKKPLHKPVEKVKVTQVFEFAGEEVTVEKEVPVDSAEARLLKAADKEAPKTSKGKRSAGLSGINNVLSQLTKKPKISTLEKSKLDWDKFKKEENIDEELQTFNKGKDGYLDRQDFLERADLRRFEIEKEIRAIERSKRFSSTL